VYKENNPGKLYNSYISIEEELNWISNIGLVKKQCNIPSDFINQIRELINEGIPVIIFVDPIVLPYSRNYKTRSVTHTVTVIAYDKDSLTIIDDVQNFKGRVGIEDILQAAEMVQYRYQIIYLNKNKPNYNITEEDFKEVINRNTTALLGKSSKEHPEINQNMSVIMGVNGIEKFINDYREMPMSIPKNVLFEELYRSLYGLSNQHALYAEFLSMSSYSNNHYSKLIKVLHEISQEWKIAAIIIYKAKHKNDEELYKSMIRKIEEIVKYENELIMESERLAQEINV
jgi:hypothetical protein